jgi:hypothetical protein
LAKPIPKNFKGKQVRRGAAAKPHEAKAVVKQRIMDYLTNPENEWPTRSNLALAMGYASYSSLNRAFNPEALDEIENEARHIRITRYKDKLSKVDLALAKKAQEGDTAAIKLAYQRFEGFSERLLQHTVVEHRGLGISSEELLKVLKDGKGEGQDMIEAQTIKEISG